MQLKDSSEALFHHYILDVQRRGREYKYVVGMIVSLAAFFLWVWWVYTDPPTSTIGNIPTICFVIIILQVLYYFVFTCYIGNKVLDVEKDVREGLNGPMSVKNG